MTSLWADPETCEHSITVARLTIGRLVYRTAICALCNTKFGHLRPITRKR